VSRATSGTTSGTGTTESIPSQVEIGIDNDGDGDDDEEEEEEEQEQTGPVSVDHERQVLLLFLLAQVCALHDPTPRTFTVRKYIKSM
jgi:hypothetical protein